VQMHRIICQQLAKFCNC